MASGVVYVALGVELNLTLPDLGHPELPDLWEQLHGRSKVGMLQCLQCRDSDPGCPEWMYLRVRNGRREAVHLNPKIEGHDAPESDEHKALKERIAKAATTGGFEAVIEAAGPKRHRVTDVLVIGDGIKLGFEAQFSSISISTVVRRSAKATIDGIMPVWTTTDRKANVINRAPWARIDRLPWHQYLDQTDLPVRGGVRGLIIEECSRRGLVCPDRKAGRKCRGWHGRWEPREVRRFDDLIVQAAGRTYVSVKQAISRLRAFWFWALATDVAQIEPLEADNGRVDSHAVGSAMLVEQYPRPLDWVCHYGAESGYSSPADRPETDAEMIAVEPPVRRPTPVLDWSSGRHYSPLAAPCRICGRPAYTRDGELRPCHKVCAEAALVPDGQVS